MCVLCRKARTDKKKANNRSGKQAGNGFKTKRYQYAENQMKESVECAEALVDGVSDDLKLSSTEICDLDVCSLQAEASDILFELPSNAPTSPTTAASGVKTCCDKPCSPHLALHAIEVSLRPGILDKYLLAYAANKHLTDDSIYVTWRQYRDKCVEDGEEMVPGVLEQLN